MNIWAPYIQLGFAALAGVLLWFIYKVIWPEQSKQNKYNQDLVKGARNEVREAHEEVKEVRNLAREDARQNIESNQILLREFLGRMEARDAEFRKLTEGFQKLADSQERLTDGVNKITCRYTPRGAASKKK